LRWLLFELLPSLQLVAHLADRRLDGVHASLRGIGAQGCASGRHKDKGGSQRDAGALPRQFHLKTPASSKPLLQTCSRPYGPSGSRTVAAWFPSEH
jgi:hypothetical protein